MWASKTPTNLKELELQRTPVKEKIRLHQDSSPTPIHEAVDKIVNFAHHVDGIMAPNIETEKALQEANEQNNTREPTFFNGNPVMDREMLQNPILDLRPLKTATRCQRHSLDRTRCINHNGAVAIALLLIVMLVLVPSF